MITGKLGASGIECSRIGLGCMGMSEFYGPLDDQESLRTLDRAIEMGINFWDTADAYGPFTNEELIGKSLKGRRNKVVLATKFGFVRKPDDPVWRGMSGKPDYVRKACEDSLRRLQTDTIDLYYLHRVDPETPIEDTVGAMASLVKEGKIHAIGLSEVSPATLKRAQAIHPISALQTEFSLWSRDPEDELIALCAEMNIAFVAYSPLGRGFLTGEIKSVDDLAPDDWRRNAPRFQGDNFRKNLELAERIKTMAGKKGCSPAQLSLAWVLHKGKHIFPIPGTKRVRYLEENAAAAALQLSEAEMKEIDEVFPKEMVAGTRYTEGGMKIVNR
jgi:aryl-alcohol dehydrogenase-like predicted oxidoreductase